MAKTTRDANVLIGPGGPCYHQRETANSVETVETIRKWGGKPVLAHPHQIPEAFRWRIIRSLAEAGLFGIEVYSDSYAEIEDIGKFLLPYEVFHKLRRD